VRRARACRSDREGRETSEGWAGTVLGGGAADRRVQPVSGAGEHGARARGRADARGPAREEKEMGRPDAQYCFGFV
jgi:hypothetical protein